MVIDVIDVSTPDRTQVTAARKAYDALTSEQKALVTNYDDLVAAENKLAEAKESKGLGAGFIVSVTMAALIVFLLIVWLVIYTLEQKGVIKRRDK